MRTGLIRATLCALALVAGTTRTSEATVVFSDSFEYAALDTTGLFALGVGPVWSVGGSPMANVDIVTFPGSGVFDIPFAMGDVDGFFVDLAGTASKGDPDGVLTSKPILLPSMASYTLSFELAGSHRTPGFGGAEIVGPMAPPDHVSVTIDFVTMAGTFISSITSKLFTSTDAVPMGYVVGSPHFHDAAPFIKYSLPSFAAPAGSYVQIKFNTRFHDSFFPNGDNKSILLDNLSLDDGLTTPPSAAPEPTSCALFGLGLLGLAAVRRRQAKQAA
jgi:hypothetical protein